MPGNWAVTAAEKARASSASIACPYLSFQSHTYPPISSGASRCSGNRSAMYADRSSASAWRRSAHAVAILRRSARTESGQSESSSALYTTGAIKLRRTGDGAVRLRGAGGAATDTNSSPPSSASGSPRRERASFRVRRPALYPRSASSRFSARFSGTGSS